MGTQMMLLCAMKGLGMRIQSDVVTDAAFVASASQAECNLKGRPAALCPGANACQEQRRQRVTDQRGSPEREGSREGESSETAEARKRAR